MKVEDLKTGMLVLMKDGALRLIIGGSAIGGIKHGGISVKNLKFNKESKTNLHVVDKVYAEPKEVCNEHYAGDMEFWLGRKHFLDSQYSPEILWQRRPDLKVDDRILVRDKGHANWVKQYFAKWSGDGRIVTFVDGKTSWTADSKYRFSYWYEWKLPYEN